MNKTQFQLENDKLLEDILNNRFFNEFKKPFDKQNDITYIELYITSTCNQNCSYCYLVKNGDKLYPKEIRNKDLILKNTRILLQYLIDNNYCNITRVDLFSGEIWNTKFGEDFLSLFLEYIGENKLNIKEIMIPSNVSFIYDDTIVEKINNFIEKYNEKHVRLMFSASIDGKIIELDTRPFNNSEDNFKKELDENYDKLFKWCKKHMFGFHPMLSSHSINKWIENYDWWIEKFEQYGFINELHGYYMSLEVRNDDWNNRSIREYLKLLDHMINVEYIKYYKKNKKELLYEMFTRKSFENPDKCINYMCYGIPNMTKISCSLTGSSVIRLGDLSICPCHRTSYPEFIYGKFDVQDDKIVGITANNVQLAYSVYNSDQSSYIMCDNCAIKYICLKGCLGSQFEANREILSPCLTVCELFKAKNIYLYNKLSKLNAFNMEFNDPSIDNMIQSFSICINNLRITDKNIWNKWATVAMSIATKIE